LVKQVREQARRAIVNGAEAKAAFEIEAREFGARIGAAERAFRCAYVVRFGSVPLSAPCMSVSFSVVLFGPYRCR